MPAPRITFPESLPVSGKRDEIAQAMARHQVVIVCGETGSGKTTQLPKIALAMGRGKLNAKPGEKGRLIGHTQPRRIAASSVARRIAEELETPLGEVVGYKVRFQDRLSRDASVKLMTDGILLAETQTDPLLQAYDTLIIDEAHERSLNIDFLLGYLRQLLPRRPDLKIVVTSATIDADRFAEHFASAKGKAPIIYVSGRMYPVEQRYRPFEESRDYGLDEAIADAVDELWQGNAAGDILVFLPGEREIREAADHLRKHLSHSPLTRGADVLPLFSRLSQAEQDRVFESHSGRRIVLATNVAETSLTVPGIRYVIDAGTARVKRYSFRSKVEQLLVEPVSQAAANQRAGRCGRVANGICIRLYDEPDFNARPRFSDPEILRSSLAGVILRMKSLGLGDVEAFPFLEPPPRRAIADGYALLGELNAVDERNELTVIGRELARLPLDPRVGRMLIGARDEGCLEQMLVIASALSLQDPRERPSDKAAAADEKHKRFADERSDFLAYLKLWKFNSEGASRRQCRENFLSYIRLREWRDIHAQLRQTVEELDWKTSSVRMDKPDGYRSVHWALLTGLLGNVGLKDESEINYTGARGIKFWVHPGSGTKKPGKWIMAAELVETTRLFARGVATIDPKWLEELGAHLLKRHQERPHWEKSRSQVVAVERGTLYGLPVYADRRVHYGPIDPKLSREIFLRSALVEGEFETRASFFAHNQRLLHEIERLEHKSRRPDILVDDELIYAFYDARVPEGIHNGADFDNWRKEAERTDPTLLQLRREDLMRHEAAGITTDNFPHEVQLGPNRFGLEYHFEPRSPRDGVTLNVPVALLNQVPAARCEWLVPGLLKEKAQAYAKNMPQRLRHKLGPLAEFSEAFAGAVSPSDTPLAAALARYIRAEIGIEVPADAFRPDSAPPHLHMNFRVLDEHGRQLAMGRNLAELKRDYGFKTEEILESEVETPGEVLTSWNFGDLEEVMEIERGGQTLVGYPALQDAGEGVVLQVVDSPERARELHRAGLRRLLAIVFKERVRDLEKGMAKDMVLAAVKEDIVAAALDRTFLAESLPMLQAEFARRVQEGRNRFNLIAQEMQRLAVTILAEHAQVQKRLAAAQKAWPQAAEDVKQQCAQLLQAGFLARTPWERLQHFPRYLKAAAARLDKLRADAARDVQRMAELMPLEQAFRREIAARGRTGIAPGAELEQFGWLLQELRVSLFAQELRTPVPVSAKRLAKLWQSIRK